MRQDNVKVIIWGLGAMGRGMAEMLLEKKGIEIVGVAGRNEKLGKSMFDYLEKENPYGKDVLIGTPEEVITPGAADVVLLCTDSYTKEAFPRIVFCLEKGINVISTAEEMAYPKAQQPELAKTLDAIAREHGVSVLGTGINPGLIMDLLVVCLTGACERVDAVEAKRVNNLSPFGPVVMHEQGVGITPEEFERRTKDGSLAGHVGFAESIHMIADALGWTLSAPVQTGMTPIFSKVERKAPYATVAPGAMAGVDMRGTGEVDGRPAISMIHPQQVEPQAEGVQTGDYIHIQGVPDIHMAITPEVPGGIGTIAMCVNMIPHIINARPGLRTMLDLPVPRAMMGDVREWIEEV
ncbi:2,4-diaminopentanoate dehydrogenase [Clostridiaceae bacterium JG1575]|nr:2,4-diaminopentanoate dehydrogenase [Clostridiaceae bacterium JG1575]